MGPGTDPFLILIFVLAFGVGAIFGLFRVIGLAAGTVLGAMVVAHGGPVLESVLPGEPWWETVVLLLTAVLTVAVFITCVSLGGTAERAYSNLRLPVLSRFLGGGSGVIRDPWHLAQWVISSFTSRATSRP